MEKRIASYCTEFSTAYRLGRWDAAVRTGLGRAVPSPELTCYYYTRVGLQVHQEPSRVRMAEFRDEFNVGGSRVVVTFSLHVVLVHTAGQGHFDPGENWYSADLAVDCTVSDFVMALSPRVFKAGVGFGSVFTEVAPWIIKQMPGISAAICYRNQVIGEKIGSVLEEIRNGVNELDGRFKENLAKRQRILAGKE